jgi:hypothetical protein
VKDIKRKFNLIGWRKVVDDALRRGLLKPAADSSPVNPDSVKRQIRRHASRGKNDGQRMGGVRKKRTNIAE